MKPEEFIIWQFENFREIYLASFQRLVTITTLINSGGILLNTTVLTEKSNLFGNALIFCNYSFYPLKWSLISFVIALAVNFYILFSEFKYCNNEFKRFSHGLQNKKIYEPDLPTAEKFTGYLWRLGKISFCLMGLGIVLALWRIVTIT